MRLETEQTTEQRTRQTPLNRPSAEEPVLTTRDLIGASTPGELDLFPLLMLLRTNLWRTLLMGLLGLLVAAGYTYTRKPRYSATASILIPQSTNPSTSSLVLQAATGLDLLGGGYEVYLDILRSHAVSDKLIEQYNLKAHYKTGSLEGAEFTLFNRTGMFAAKEGMVWVTVQDEDPKMAADLANGYFTQLSQLNAHLGITAAGQLRRYYEGEMAKERDQLAQAEAELVQNQEKTGVIQPAVQATAALGAEEAIRAQLRAREIELQGVLQGATQQSPQVVRLNAEIAGLRSQLNGIQSSGGADVGTPAAKQPSQALEFARKERDVKFHEALMEMLTRQYETARQQESKDISMIELLDVARPSPFSDWPPSRAWLSTGLLAGLALGIVWTLLQGLWGIIFNNPLNRARMAALRQGAR